MVGLPGAPSGLSPLLQRGAVIAGKYRVERVLGEGGMGVVVAATHLDLHELRALKFLLPSALRSPTAVDRFLREARAAARLKSEHVAAIHDVGRLDDGMPYLVMEYLEGTDLKSLLKQHGPLPPDVAALYMLQACAALSEAHARGIVHRDLKPANLFLARRANGTPCIKVLDFGISKLVEGTDGEAPEMTDTNALLGSPAFMSPEQMQSAKYADARSDIWSLGVTLYRLVTGQMPFQGQSIVEMVNAVFRTTPAPPSQVRPGLPPGLDAVILRCLALQQDARFQRVNDLAAALAPFSVEGSREVIEGPVRSLGPPPPEPDTPPPRTSGAISGPDERSATGTGTGTSAARPRAPFVVAGVATVMALTVGVGVGVRRWLEPAPGSAPSPEASAPALEHPSAQPGALVSATSAPPVVTPAAPSASALPSASAAATSVGQAPRPNASASPRRPRPSGDTDDAFGSGRK